MTNTEIGASHGTVQWRLDCRDICPGEQVSCRPTDVVIVLVAGELEYRITAKAACVDCENLTQRS